MKYSNEHFPMVITDKVALAVKKFKSIFYKNKKRQDEILVNSIAMGVKAHVEVFSGLYEPMHMVASGCLGGKMGAFDEWCLRSGNINDGTSYSEIFISRFSNFRNWNDTEFIKNAQLILKATLKAGVARDSFKELVADESTCLRYGTLDGREIKEGETVQIFMPCWHKDNLILEMGIIR